MVVEIWSVLTSFEPKQIVRHGTKQGATRDEVSSRSRVGLDRVRITVVVTVRDMTSQGLPPEGSWPSRPLCMSPLLTEGSRGRNLTQPIAPFSEIRSKVKSTFYCEKRFTLAKFSSTDKDRHISQTLSVETTYLDHLIQLCTGSLPHTTILYVVYSV